jgi:hypothetical protein
MFNSTFNHRAIRNTVVSFGSLFNGLKVTRTNPDGSTLQELDVPLAYSAKEKWVTRLTGNPDLLRSTSITLPRMGFEMTGIRYDPARKLNSNNRFTNIVAGNPSTLNSAFAPVPYNVEFALYLAAKTIEDSLQMLEQILPYFTPHYNISVNTLPELGIVQDIPVILNTTDSTDNYETDWQEERLIFQTLRFTAKINLFGPITSGGAVIKKTDTINLYASLNGTIPDARFYSAVNPQSANKTDVFTIDELWQDI